jgi:thymidylate synthase (FAD)
MLKKCYEAKKLWDKGFVRLVDHMPYKIQPPLYCDEAITQMARISYGEGTKKLSSDKALIRYLMKNHHTSPFEAVEFKFHMKIPLFVERQLIRHRTASVNQISGRYSILPSDYYVPKTVRTQSTLNKQGSEGCLDEKGDKSDFMIASYFRESCKNIEKHNFYEKIIARHNVSREVARIILPQNIMTELYWKIDLHNLLHFLHLRQDTHAQQKIQDLANAIYNIIREFCPFSTQAYMDYRVNALQFSAQEILCIREFTTRYLSSKREVREFQDKCNKLGLKIPK